MLKNRIFFRKKMRGGGDVDYMIERCGGHGGSDVSRRRRVVKVVIREAVQSFKTCSLSVQENGKREMGRR